MKWSITKALLSKCVDKEDISSGNVNPGTWRQEITKPLQSVERECVSIYPTTIQILLRNFAGIMQKHSKKLYLFHGNYKFTHH